MKLKNFAAFCFCVVTLVLLALVAPSYGQIAPYSVYGNWSMTLQSPVSATGTATVSVYPCYFTAGNNTNGHQFFPLSTVTAVQVLDGSNSETVTPSAVGAPVPTQPQSSSLPYTCSFTASFSNTHLAGVTVRSGDGGTTEAANDNGAAYGLGAGLGQISGTCTTAPGSASTFYLVGLGAANTARTCSITTGTGQTFVAGRKGALKNLSVTAGTGGVSSSSGVFTVYKNGSSTAITCTLGTGTSCSDTTHVVAFSAGDVITLPFTSQASETMANINATVQTF